METSGNAYDFSYLPASQTTKNIKGKHNLHQRKLSKVVNKS